MAAQHNMSVWRDSVRSWYPDYETRTYFVPPVVITRIPFDVVTVAGQDVVVPHCSAAPAPVPSVRTKANQAKRQRVQESHTRDDLALQWVLLFLREMASQQNEPMFIVSELQFSSYLGKSCYAAAAKLFTRPQNLPEEYRQGDFDILIIHRHHGILTGEIKSVLSNQQQIKLSQRDTDRVVAEKVRHAAEQLDKSEVVLREITKDLAPQLVIRKTLILPYVTAGILNRVLSSDKQLKQDLVTCLRTSRTDDVVEWCLLADHFSTPQKDVVNVQQLQTWWKKHVAVNSDQNMVSKLYLDLLARFCGPATTVSVYCSTSPRIEVRTEGQVVAVVGERMTSLVLTPEQIGLMTRAPAKVLLTGPPGVGKSVMLILMALTWLRQGHDVQLVSVDGYSLAATRLINHVINQTISADSNKPRVVGSVHLQEYDFYNTDTDINKAINTITATNCDHGSFIVCDEFWTIDSLIPRYQQFLTDLCTRLRNVHFWAASLYNNWIPAELQEERMTIPLRCPPAVLDEVGKGVSKYSNVHPYTTSALATPCDGPRVIHLSHQGPGHTERWPLECEMCGQSIAAFLKGLMIGETGACGSSSSAGVTSDHHTNTSKTISCPPLQYRDVFVLTRSENLRDDVTDDAGRLTARANGVVRGLRDAGVPVHVIRKEHESSDVCDTAVARSDVVTVAYNVSVSGLERKVVVWLKHRRAGDDDELSDDDIEARTRLHAMSRCTAQLVVVDAPLSGGDGDIAVSST